MSDYYEDDLPTFVNLRQTPGSSAEFYGTVEQATSIDPKWFKDGLPPEVSFPPSGVRPDKNPVRESLTKRMMDALKDYPNDTSKWDDYEAANRWAKFKMCYPRWLRWLMKQFEPKETT